MGLAATQQPLQSRRRDAQAIDRQQQVASGQPRRMTLFDLWKQTTARLDILLGSLPREGFVARCDTFATQLMALIDRDPDIGIYHSVRQDPKRLSLYGLNHALHCAMVGQLAARRAGWDDTRVRTLVKAALTMNLSIVEVQGRFATMGRLNDTQRDQIRAHPQAAHDQLQRELVAVLQVDGGAEPGVPVIPACLSAYRPAVFPSWEVRILIHEEANEKRVP